jgi:hypothetical protein
MVTGRSLREKDGLGSRGFTPAESARAVMMEAAPVWCGWICDEHLVGKEWWEIWGGGSVGIVCTTSSCASWAAMRLHGVRGRLV